MFLSHGGADSVVPISGSEVLARELCEDGEAVVFRTSADWDHNTGYFEVRTELFGWLAAAARGEQLTSTC